jgi:pimeloyl-ACP methyl ester carboxylesterase
MPTFTTRDGCELRYEITGRGRPVAITPGGREGGAALAPLIAELSTECRVLSWDRRNAGASDVFFGGDGSEQEIWADDLAELLRATEFGPAVLAGGSAGCRVALLAATRHPAIVSALVLWSASGGWYGSQVLGFNYHTPYIMAAQRGGMAAVAETPFFADRIRANPANGERLLGLDPNAFVATMKRWNLFFQHRTDTPLVGLTEDELRGIAVPTLVFEGNDDIHPPEVAEAIARLIPGARFAPSPWPREAWMDRFTGRIPGMVFDLYPRLAPDILGFLRDLPA